METKIPFIVPCFSGFYDSIWSAESVDEYQLADYFDCEIEDITPEIFDSIDYKEYYHNVAIECSYFISNAIEDVLGVSGITPINVKVISPREYNFSTDKIECELIIKDYDAFISSMEKYISEHHDIFVLEAKESFTSRDGFISFYSNKFDELDWENDEILLGWVMGIILSSENKDIEDDMYGYVRENGGYPEAYFMAPDDHTKARDIIKNFDPIAVKYEEDKDGWEVLIKDNYSSLEFWMDVWIDKDGDMQYDWNQFIFNTSGIDATRSDIQDDSEVCMVCSDVALQYLIDNDRVYEDENDKWHKK